MADSSSREKVLELRAKDLSAKEIAEKLGMSQANVYAHFRKADAESGAPKRGRGRPPKVTTEGKSDSKSTSKADKSESKATRPAPGKATAKAAASNGHVDGDFSNTLAGIDKDLEAARARVTKLEKMREVLVG